SVSLPPLPPTATLFPYPTLFRSGPGSLRIPGLLGRARGRRPGDVEVAGERAGGALPVELQIVDQGLRLRRGVLRGGLLRRRLGVAARPRPVGGVGSVSLVSGGGRWMLLRLGPAVGGSECGRSCRRGSSCSPGSRGRRGGR